MSRKQVNYIKKTIQVIKDIITLVPFYFLLSLLSVLVDALWSFVSPLALSHIFDNLPNMEIVSILIWRYIFFSFIIQIIQMIGNIADNNGIYEKLEYLLHTRFVNCVSRLSPVFFESHDNLGKAACAKSCITQEAIPNIWRCFIDGIGGIIATAGMLCTLASFNLILSLLGIITVIPMFVVYIMQGKEKYNLEKKQIYKKNKLANLKSLFFNQDIIQEMKLLNCYVYLQSKWHEINEQVLNEKYQLELKQIRRRGKLDFIKVTTYTMGIIASIILAILGKINIGQLGACFILFYSCQKSISQVVSRISEIPGLLSYSDDFYDFIDSKKNVSGNKNFLGIKTKIECKNLFFRYPGELNYCINGLNFEIKKGEKIAIIGENGSGKTTLSKLISGIFPATAGEVLYDGINIKKYSTESLVKKLGIMAQNFVKYSFLFKDAVSISDVSRLDNNLEIITALKKAGMDMKYDLHQQLGREFGGIDLSGGEWQRLALARAFFKDSSLIIMDEPTSAIDPIAEDEIMMKILWLTENKTSIIISHRLSLCPYMDRIFLMEQGDIVEIGTHSELIQKRGKYYKMYISQARWYQSPHIHGKEVE